MSGHKKTLYKTWTHKKNIKKDSNRYFAEKVWRILNFISQKAREIIRICTKRALLGFGQNALEIIP